MQGKHSEAREIGNRNLLGTEIRWADRIKPYLVLCAILGMGLAFRLYGIDWDCGYLFHPDERKIFMVVDDLKLPFPFSWETLLSPDSPLNPHFFAYGSFPMYLLKLIAYVASRFRSEGTDIHSLYLIGRPLSALFDLGTIVLIYSLGSKLYSRQVGLLSAAFMSFAVLHIQLSHFYAVDTILTFFIVLSVYIAILGGHHKPLVAGVWLGISTGLALATKLSAAPLILIDLMAWRYWLRVERRQNLSNCDTLSQERGRPRVFFPWLLRVLGGFALTMAIALLVFVLTEPYAVIDFVGFFLDALGQGWMASGVIDAPYTRQYWGRPDYLYEIKQLVVWSLGLPLGVTALAGAVFTIVRAYTDRRREDILALCWPVIYFAITGSFLAKFLRYMLPVIPFLCLFAARFLCFLVRRARPGWAVVLAKAVLVTVLGATGLYALAFMNVYTQQHPWVEMTEWICEAIPAGAVLTEEHWDDSLPLEQAKGSLDCWARYGHVRMEMYNEDSEQKLDWLIDDIIAADYIILSSNRLYGTIPRLEERYPIASQYYRSLFEGELGFELVKHVSVYPRLGPVTLVNDTFSDAGLPMPTSLRDCRPSPVVLNLGHADESFVVYDHPMPMVFRKVRSLSKPELRALFAEALRQALAHPWKE